jgi:transposase InsO family protein
MEEVLEMSNKELERFRILSAIKDKQISQIQGAQMLNLSTRQIHNLLKTLTILGPKGLISKKRGKSSNRSFNAKFKQEILSIIHHHYSDFGPTLIKEKLLEKHLIKISDETLRSWMIEANMWIPKQRKRNKYRLRSRKSCFGELIQVDGSHHDWFEGKREKCVLIVFIDDATSKITSLYFAEGESLDAYFTALENHINKYGRPKGIYSDRLSVFQSCKDESLTQFKYALKLLDISHFTARTPQAKGRVERVNQTLQDRLIKEMRLQNIRTIEEANEYLKEYIEMHNNKFSKEPASTFDAHRPLETDLSRILCRYEERTLTNDLSIHFHNKIYQICEELPKKAKIEIRKQKDGKLRFFFKDQELTYIPYDELPLNTEIKELIWLPGRTGKPKKANHPYKNRLFNTTIKEKEMATWESNYKKVI